MPSQAVDANAPKPRPYTPDDVVQQSLVAFGQGTDYMRVNRDAAQGIVDLMRATVERTKVHERWETDAVQILERLRAVGRVAALYATQDGRTVINGEDVSKAAVKVQLASKTNDCSRDSIGTSFPTSLD